MRTKLKDICIINPKSPGFQDDLSVSFVPMSKIGEQGEFDPSEVRTYQEVKKGFTYFQNGDILFAKITPCMENGKGAVARSLENGVGFGSTEFHVLRPLTEFVTSEWLFYLLNWQTFRKEAERNMIGSAGQKRVPKTFLEEYSVDIPVLEKQREMTNILNRVCNLISLRKQQLAKLDELVKARFVEMFGDPVINPFRYEKHPLSDYCDLQNGFAFKSEDYIEKSDVLNCRMSNIRTDGSFSVDYNPKYLPTDYWDKFSLYRLFDGDVIIAMTDMANDPKILGVPTIVSCFGKKMLLNQRVGKLLFRDNIEINRVYLMKALSHENVRARLAQNSGGGLQINVGKPAILNSIILYPPISQQNQFAEFSSKVDSEKNTIQWSISKLEILRKSLMQEYFE